MNFDVEHLQTLLAVVDAGSFDDASIDLGVTPSAVSQRIKVLENRLGTVLLVRSRPVVPTEQGTRVLRYARQIAALSQEFSREVAQTGFQRLAVGVNADSLSTWFAPVYSRIAEWEDVAVEILRTDENRSLDLLRSGRVSAVVTNSGDAAQGCTVRTLGSMRYHAVCTRTFRKRHMASLRPDILAQAPVVVFDREDPLQHQMLDYLGTALPRTGGKISMVPDSWQFMRAIQSGMGWGMVPEQQLRDADDLVILDPAWHIDVPLYFQRWAVDSAILERLETSLVEVAHQAGLDLLA